jgi:hypothetical protein
MSRLTAVVLVALTLGPLASVPVAFASNIVGTAVTIGGLDDLSATADTHARKGVGKVIAMVLGMGGAALVLSGKVGLGLSGVGAGIGMGFMPGIMSTAFDAAPAASFDVLTQSSVMQAWWAPLTAGLYPGLLALRLVQDPVVIVAAVGTVALMRVARAHRVAS